MHQSIRISFRTAPDTDAETAKAIMPATVAVFRLSVASKANLETAIGIKAKFASVKVPSENFSLT